MSWPDGQTYEGQFKNAKFHGFGIMNIPSKYRHEGMWKDGIRHGYGITRYDNGDIYSGYYKDNLKHGHGLKKTGRYPNTDASVYVGEWVNDQRHGYGVENVVNTGEKYMGMWYNNLKHGPGLVVNLDGVYYEGTFEKGVLVGHGVMIFEDGSHYDGELKEAGVFAGKGTLTLASGDRIEGTLQGSRNQGLRVNGTLFKSFTLPKLSPPLSLGSLSVSADAKWKPLFENCWSAESGSKVNPWDAIVAALSNKSHQNTAGPRDGLRTVLRIGQGEEELSTEHGRRIVHYLEMAFDCKDHPLGRLLHELAVAYTTTYGEVLVNRLLLQPAVEELRSITRRLYSLVRELFPSIPPHNSKYPVSPSSLSDMHPAHLLHPIILPKVYPSLFFLYSLHNKDEDEAYWRRLLKWNRHSDSILMESLGISRRFWANEDGTLKKENMFAAAIETLQQIKSKFSPIEKLTVIKDMFVEIPKAVMDVMDIKENVFVGGADDILPICLYIVVRSHVTALGSELHFIGDFIDFSQSGGESGYLLTMINASFKHILMEKIIIPSGP